ncbi:MAG TPA: TonB family protein [Blastocatellia bacterium]|nr:TonB family protein [Blastocatellia bacterium]
MKFSLMALCVWISIAAQSESFEKRAMSMVQQLPASNLDAKLPNRPFLAWFNELIGQEAGVVWQLAECGAPVNIPGGGGQDVPACAEATVILPSGDRMIVAISVGTFKKGMIGEPAFLRAVVESGEQLYQVRRLRDLPEMLREPRNLPAPLPDLQPGPPQIKLRPLTSYFPLAALGGASAPVPLLEDETPPPAPTSLKQSQKSSQAMVEGTVITRVKAVYPVSARSMNAYGKVDVRVVISESGRVIEAKAISGHPALRNAAMDAARQWVYKPATLNGVPVKMESVLTFTFAPGGQ